MQLITFCFFTQAQLLTGHYKKKKNSFAFNYPVLGNTEGDTRKGKIVPYLFGKMVAIQMVLIR